MFFVEYNVCRAGAGTRLLSVGWELPQPFRNEYGTGSLARRCFALWALWQVQLQQPRAVPPLFPCSHLAKERGWPISDRAGLSAEASAQAGVSSLLLPQQPPHLLKIGMDDAGGFQVGDVFQKNGICYSVVIRKRLTLPFAVDLFRFFPLPIQ